MHTTRVILAEDHHVVRSAIAALLSKESDIEVVGEVAEASTLIQVVETLRPDVLVLDAHMPGHRVIDSVRVLRREYPKIRILVLSAYDRQEYVVGLLGAGAAGYVLKDDPPETLLRALRAVAQGERWLSPRVVEVLARSTGGEGGGPGGTLTEREVEVLQLIARGYDNERIARTLVITEQTVKNHVRNIFSKLGVKTRVEAVLYALHQGLAPSEPEVGGQV